MSAYDFLGYFFPIFFVVFGLIMTIKPDLRFKGTPAPNDKIKKARVLGLIILVLGALLAYMQFFVK